MSSCRTGLHGLGCTFILLWEKERIKRTVFLCFQAVATHLLASLLHSSWVWKQPTQSPWSLTPLGLLCMRIIFEIGAGHSLKLSYLLLQVSSQPSGLDSTTTRISQSPSPPSLVLVQVNQSISLFIFQGCLGELPQVPAPPVPPLALDTALDLVSAVPSPHDHGLTCLMATFIKKNIFCVCVCAQGPVTEGLLPWKERDLFFCRNHNGCFWIVMLENTLKSPLDSKEIKPVNPKGNQPWIFIGRTDAKIPILWTPNVKSQLIGKNLDAGKSWRQDKWAAEAEMVGWHHHLNGHESEQAPGDSKGLGSLVCCSPWGCKESDIT